MAKASRLYKCTNYFIFSIFLILIYIYYVGLVQPLRVSKWWMDVRCEVPDHICGVSQRRKTKKDENMVEIDVRYISLLFLFLRFYNFSASVLDIRLDQVIQACRYTTYYYRMGGSATFFFFVYDVMRFFLLLIILSLLFCSICLFFIFYSSRMREVTWRCLKITHNSYIMMKWSCVLCAQMLEKSI